LINGLLFGFKFWSKWIAAAITISTKGDRKSDLQEATEGTEVGRGGLREFQNYLAQSGRGSLD